MQYRGMWWCSQAARAGVAPRRPSPPHRARRPPVVQQGDPLLHRPTTARGYRNGDQRVPEKRGPRAANPGRKKERRVAREERGDVGDDPEVSVVCWGEEWLVDSDTQKDQHARVLKATPPKRKTRKGRRRRGSSDDEKEPTKPDRGHGAKTLAAGRAATPMDVIEEIYELEVWGDRAGARERARIISSIDAGEAQDPASHHAVAAATLSPASTPSSRVLETSARAASANPFAVSSDGEDPTGAALMRRGGKGKKEKRRKQNKLMGCVPYARDAVAQAAGQEVDIEFQSPPPGYAGGPIPTQTDPVVYTWNEIAAASRDGRAWVVLHRQVYDVTDFLDVHPGGRAMLEAYRGLDITKMFEAFNHPAQTAHLLHRMWVGELAAGESREASAAKKRARPRNNSHTRGGGGGARGTPTDNREESDEEEEEQVWVLEYEGAPPDFVMTVGIPGSGKSTWVDERVVASSAAGADGLLPSPPLVVVSTDAIRRELTGSVAYTNIEGQVWDLARDRIVHALLHGHNTILDATNTISRHRMSLTRSLPPCNLFAKVFTASCEEASRRIAADLDVGIERSNVPRDVVRKMHEQFMRDLPLLPTEGFDLM